jgi:hypothetical protein
MSKKVADIVLETLQSAFDAGRAAHGKSSQQIDGLDFQTNGVSLANR